MQITITQDLEQDLIECARRQGKTPERLALDALRDCFSRRVDDRPQQAESLADFLGQSIGAIGSSELVPGGARMSEACGNHFAAGMVKKREQGRL